MHKTFRALGAAGALLCLTATVAAAQNNSDHIATLISTAPNSGGYGVGSAGRGGNAAAPAVTPTTIANQSTVLLGGSDAQKVVGAILAGGSTVAFGNSLVGAGAQPAAVNALMLALSNLSSNPSPAALQSAIREFNNVVNTASTGFVNGPPPAFLALRAALLALAGL